MNTDAAQRNIAGLINPYALAELIRGEKISWDKQSFDGKKAILEDTFNFPYEKLFDPKQKSPLYTKGIVKTTTDGKKNTLQLVEVEAGCDSDTPCVPADTWDTVPNAQYTVNTQNVRDPIQGAVPNCWLIAPLASIAWDVFWNKTATTSINAPQPGDPDTYSFKFYEKDPNDSTKTITYQQSVSAKLPFLNCSRIGCYSTDKNECWPSLYEKAYYSWWEYFTTGVNDDTPNYCSLSGGNPLRVIQQLTARQTQSVVIETKNFSADAVFSDIYGLSKTCTKIARNCITKNPVVAWTYDTRIRNPKGYQYVTGTLPSNHAFSILGTVGIKTDPTASKYIVLRNPHGMACGDPTVPGLLTAGTWCDGINWSDQTDGIFALSAEEFVKAIETYGWGIA